MPGGGSVAKFASDSPTEAGRLGRIFFQLRYVLFTHEVDIEYFLESKRLSYFHISPLNVLHLLRSL